MFATLVKATGETRETLGDAFITDESYAWEPAFHAALHANMRGTASALTRFLVVSEDGRTLAGYYAVNLDYTEE
jgi:hypothetical protein